MPAGYRILPEIYDRWQATYGSDFTTLILPRLLATLKRYPAPERSLLDVACGTGTLVLEMSRRGWEARGIDASQGMIDVCRRKPASGISTALFECLDMRNFVLPVRTGLVTALFDAVNHLLTIRDLRAFLASAFRVLLPGGLLIFDVNNEACYRTLWKGTTTAKHPDFTLTLNNHYIPSRRRARSSVHVAYHGSEDRPPAFENVDERCFSREELTRALSGEGFTVLQSEDFAFSSAPEFGKLKTWWVTRRGG